LVFNEEPGSDEADVYAALHNTFLPKFEKVVKEWADGKGLQAKPHYVPLDDADCDHAPAHSRTPSSAAGAQSYIHPEESAIINERQPIDEEYYLQEVEIRPKRTSNQARAKTYQVVRPQHGRSDSNNSAATSYSQPKSSTTFVRVPTQQQAVEPPSGTVELQGPMPPHIHHHPAEEATCKLCKAGYFPYKFQSNAVIPESGTPGENVKRKSRKIFGFQVMRADG